MPDKKPCGPPLRMFVLDLERIDALLEYAALMGAISSHSDLVAKADTSLGVTLIRLNNMINPGSWIKGYWKYGSDWRTAPTYFEVHTELTEVRSTMEFNLQHYRRQFIDKAMAGPNQAIRYLEMVQRHGQRAQTLIRELFTAARNANNELLAEIDSSIRRADIVRVAAAAGITVGLSFVPGSILVLTGAAVGYSFACDLAMQAQGVSDADIVGYIKQSTPTQTSLIKKQTVNSLQNAGVNTAQSFGQFAIKNLAEQQAKAAESRYAEVVARYAKQGGAGARIRPLPKPIPLPGGGVQEAAKLTRNQAKAVQRAATKAAASESKLVSRQALARYGGGTAAAGVGLFFMRDDLLRAFGSLQHELGF